MLQRPLPNEMLLKILSRSERKAMESRKRMGRAEAKRDRSRIPQLARHYHAAVSPATESFPPVSSPPGGLSRDDALRPSEADLIEIEVGMLRTDVVKDAGDHASDP